MSLQAVVFDDDATTYAEALGRAMPEIRIHPATTQDAALAVCADAEILMALGHFIKAPLIAAMPRLRWIQVFTTGTDALAELAIPRDVIITSGRGFHGPQMAELAFLYMIALSRNFRGMLDNQAKAAWERWPQKLLFGKTAVLVGVGIISEQIAARCKAFDMRVIGVSSGRTSVPGFDEVMPRDRLKEAAARADFLIVVVPQTADTIDMIDAAVIAAMRPNAILINLARGRVVDEAAMVAALEQGRIAGAGLDVFHTEPLPHASPLWHMPNVIVTPHVGGMSDVYALQALPLVQHNLAAFASGRLTEMRNVVRGIADAGAGE